uniref:Uncharacterized protein n=1 Tax=Phaeomonas parva TaxID=124430 RepID=A0A7S1XU55_9STRA|mmetsp:Transcript_37593/g.117517  ORF Transcript_37593/g.117517 Transcript_37593/m.117517 type:complete len:167 (+) Transcript_37593:243-743(+)
MMRALALALALALLTPWSDAFALTVARWSDAFALSAQRRRVRAQSLSMSLNGFVVHTADDLACAFAGGATGVLGSLFAIEYKKSKQRARSACPYCVGEGRLPCAVCWGTGKVTLADTGVEADCPACNGRGKGICINCKGDGRMVPLMLDRRVARDPEDELEDIGLA